MGREQQGSLESNGQEGGFSTVPPATLLWGRKAVAMGQAGGGCLSLSFPPSLHGWLCGLGWGWGLSLAILCRISPTLPVLLVAMPLGQSGVQGSP